MSIYQNPFPEGDPDRRALWTMLVERDIEAFLHQDWSRIEGDFIAEGFLGVDGRGFDNPDSWRLAFPRLEDYRDAWLKQARDMVGRAPLETLRRALYEATTLRDIEINGDAALLHKKFDGALTLDDGERVILQWQTVYLCRKVGGVWKIAGFVGYLPHPMGTRRT